MPLPLISNPPCLLTFESPRDGTTAGRLRGQANSHAQVAPHPLLADPDCVVCGLLAHIPASSRGPSLRLHIIATHPSTPRAQSPALPGPAAHDMHLAKMLIRPPLSKRMMALMSSRHRRTLGQP